MKNELSETWVAYWAAKKEEAKRSGKIAGDVELAAAVTEILEEIGQPKKSRQTINCWISGKRTPNIFGFIALCKALDANPIEALSGGAGSSPKEMTKTRNDSRTSKINNILSRANADQLEQVLGVISIMIPEAHQSDQPKTGT